MLTSKYDIHYVIFKLRYPVAREREREREREIKMRVLVKTTSFMTLFTLVISIKYRIPMTDFHDLF